MEQKFDSESVSVAHALDKGTDNGSYLQERLDASFTSKEPSSNGHSHQTKIISFDGSFQNSDVDPVNSKNGKSVGISTNENRRSSATPSISIDSSYDGKHKDLMVRFKVPDSPPGKHGEEMNEGYEIDESALTDAATIESESVVKYHCPVLPPQNDGESPPPPRREETDDGQVASSREHAQPPQTRQRWRLRSARPFSFADAALATVCAIIGGLIIVIGVSMYNMNYPTWILAIVGIVAALLIIGAVFYFIVQISKAFARRFG